MATAKIENQVGKVYAGIAKILEHLSVEKNGVLPGNMGGKPYITAHDIAAEVKRQFVENNLIFIPNEKLIKHEVIPFKDRLNIATVIEGTYEIVSTEDGSSVTVTGVGDGLATGTAVSSNVASTNALKNGLLRAFLITEQSVEDAAKNGPADEPAKKSPPAERKVAAAKAATTPATPGASELNGLKEEIRKYIGGDEAKRKIVNDKMEELKVEGLSGVPLHKRLVDDLKKKAD